MTNGRHICAFVVLLPASWLLRLALKIDPSLKPEPKPVPQLVPKGQVDVDVDVFLLDVKDGWERRAH